MKPKLALLALLSLLFSICLFAQKKRKGEIANRVTCAFGDVKPDDFAPTAYAVDSSAEAVYLFEGGSSKFQGNTKGFFDVVYKVHKRIRLLKKNSFDDLSKVVISTYVANTQFEQKISDFQAATYNIEDGKVATTNVDKNSLFKEKNGDYIKTKFTFPNLKEGSIIEYSYTLIMPQPGRPFLPGWSFQGHYPRLWSEYENEVPQYYDYVVLKQGYVPYTIDTVKVSFDVYHIVDDGDATTSSQSISASANTFNHIWAMKNVPSLKSENFTTTLDNYIAKLEFQLSAIRYPDVEPKMIMHTWSNVSTELMKDEDFGATVTKANNYLDADVKAAISGVTTQEEKAKKLYEYVRDNYACTDYDARYLSQPLRKTYQNKKGNVVDINMLLIAMYMNIGLEAHPVLVSTRDNGKTYPLYPILSKFNYVICQLKINDKQYLLDASNSKLGFNHLNVDCYNGYVRVINPDLPELIDLSADSLKENSITSVFIANGDNHKMTASVTSVKGYEESLSLRNKLVKEGKDDFYKTIKKAFTDNIAVSDEKVDSLQLLDMPVTVSYSLTIDNNDEDIIYFNPMLGDQQKENPFMAAERYYPVEMPYCSDDIYVLNMEVPAGYAVDEIPKSARVKLNENEGMFEYIVVKNSDHIQLRCRVKLAKATYEPDDYQTLRDFFGFVVKKEAEQIVFKKIK